MPLFHGLQEPAVGGSASPSSRVNLYLPEFSEVSFSALAIAVCVDASLQNGGRCQTNAVFSSPAIPLDVRENASALSGMCCSSFDAHSLLCSAVVWHDLAQGAAIDMANDRVPSFPNRCARGFPCIKMILPGLARKKLPALGDLETFSGCLMCLGFGHACSFR